MTNLSPYEGNISITTRNGMILKVTNMGSINLKLLNDSILELCKNLIPIQRLTIDFPYEFFVEI